MNYYIQPEDELILSLQMEEEDYKELKALLRADDQILEVREVGFGMDSAVGPPEVAKVVDILASHHIDVKVAETLLGLGKDAMFAYVGAKVKNWVDIRNDRRKKEIEAKKTEVILYDQHGHRIDLRAESKQRKRR